MNKSNHEAQINELLTEYLYLDKDIKAKTKRLNEIRDWCKSQGTFSTEMYVCAVRQQSRTGLAGLEVAIGALGRELLEMHDLIRTSEFLIVNISSKIVKLEMDVLSEL